MCFLNNFRTVHMHVNLNGLFNVHVGFSRRQSTLAVLRLNSNERLALSTSRVFLPTNASLRPSQGPGCRWRRGISAASNAEPAAQGTSPARRLKQTQRSIRRQQAPCHFGIYIAFAKLMKHNEIKYSYIWIRSYS